MKKKIKEIIIHTIGWALFLWIPPLFGPGPSFSLGMIVSPHMQRELASNLLVIVFFYLNTHILIPKFYFNKRYVTFFLLVFVIFLIVTLVPFLTIPGSHRFPAPTPAPPPGVFRSTILFEFGHNFFRFFVAAFFSYAITISSRWQKAEQEKLSAELSYLKAQINPHFLFNTLNGIYSLAIQKSDQTAPAIVKLSAMMRYIVSEAHFDFVSIEKELTYIRSYIELQQIRFGESVRVFLSIQQDMQMNQIAPLILIPFVENAFKHGVNAEENSSIKISIHIEKGRLHMEVFNNKVFIHKSAERKSQLGIKNTRARLQLLYPAQHTLQIVDTKDNFLVLLDLNLR